MGMRLDAQDHVQIAWRAAAHARLALAADPDLRAHVDAGGDVHRQPLCLLDASLTAALLAGVLQDPARATAGRAGRRRHHLAEEGLRGAPDVARAATSRARLLAGARLCASS